MQASCPYTVDSLPSYVDDWGNSHVSWNLHFALYPSGPYHAFYDCYAS